MNRELLSKQRDETNQREVDAARCGKTTVALVLSVQSGLFDLILELDSENESLRRRVTALEGGD